jgi:squalene-associated FAD-dependent desaturase
MSDSRPRVAVIGGGLAGLSAALALAENGCAVELFEAKRNLGGRAGSFVDKATGETIDHCQHVAMGCCTNYLDFCRRVGAFDALRRVRTLHFIGPDGERCEFSPPRWLPAPLHLAAAMRRLTFLSNSERLSSVRAIGRLAKHRDNSAAMSVGEWLRQQGQSPRQIEMFWSVVLVSALGEEIERASLAAARNVFVDGFMAARSAYEVYVPTVPLARIYDDFVAHRLEALGVVVHREVAIQRISGGLGGVDGLVLRDGESRRFEHYVLAVPWRLAPKLLDGRILAAMPNLVRLADMPAAPISAVHLWFDRPITNLDHAVLVGRLSQWVFAHGRPQADERAGWHYQVVISASRNLAGRSQNEIMAAVCEELGFSFAEEREAKVLHGRVVTDRDAVFTATPEWESLRPSQTTPVPNLFLCGDWTATGWPATMEGAVRSGRLAAEGVLGSVGRNVAKNRLVTPDLPRGWLARWLIR